MNIFGWGKNPDWKRQVQALGPALAGTPSGFATPEELNALSTRLATDLPAHLNALKKDAQFIFAAATDAESHTTGNLDLLRTWHTQGNPPTLPALCIFTIEHMRLNLAPDKTQTLLTAALLGEIENTLPYHNNMHIRKVLLQLVRLIAVHNAIYEGTARAFDHNQVALLMTAACIHDLGHDGMGNTLKGIHHPGYIERRSLALAEPYFRKTGIDEQSLADLKVMLLSTDVSPLGDPGNYMNQMKAAYRFHFLGERKGLQSLNLDDDLAALQKNPALAAMSLLLHEADISTSAGLHYDITKYETSLYAREIGEDSARPSHVIEFLDTVCQQRMISDAAQKLYAANMARIHALAQEDMRAGNQPFPPPEYADLFLNRAGDEGHKTVN